MRLSTLLKAMLGALVTATLGSHAANLQISPVTITLAPGQTAAALSLQNMGDVPTYGQVRVFAWDQRDGDDTLDPTRELVASPPIVQIAPQGSQTVRLVLTGPAPAGGRTFRVWIDEVQKAGANGASGVDIQLRYSIPVFVRGAAQKPEALDWQLFRKEQAWWLELRNSGDTPAQIGTLSVTDRAGADAPVSKGLFGYVLPGRTRIWKLPLAAGLDLPAQARIQAIVNGRVLSTQAPVSAR